MAHSSGGGSSGGGCHSGGSSGGYHGSSSGQTYHRYSHHYFRGASRYSYTDRYGTKQYIYCTHNPAKRYSFPWLLFVINFFFMVMLFHQSHSLFFIPHKVLNSNSQIVIEDQQNVIRDQEALRKKLTAFYEETGVTPAVKTVSREQWHKDHISLMDYALDEYYVLFQDEKHWLIVFSMETDPSGNLLPDRWQFEGIIGDRTGPSINDWMCRKFTEHTHENLKTMSDPGEAIGRSFEKLQSQRKYNFISYNPEAVFTFLMLLLIFGAPIIREIREAVLRHKFRHAVLDN